MCCSQIIVKNHNYISATTENAKLFLFFFFVNKMISYYKNHLKSYQNSW